MYIRTIKLISFRDGDFLKLIITSFGLVVGSRFCRLPEINPFTSRLRGIQTEFSTIILRR